MVMTAENNVGAQVGDEVEIELENMNFMTAVLIAYGFPLVSLIIGIVAGYYGLLSFGADSNTAQALGSLIGIAALAASYIVIKYKEESIKKLKKLKPVIIGIRTENDK